MGTTRVRDACGADAGPPRLSMLCAYNVSHRAKASIEGERERDREFQGERKRERQSQGERPRNLAVQRCECVIVFVSPLQCPLGTYPWFTSCHRAQWHFVGLPEAHDQTFIGDWQFRGVAEKVPGDACQRLCDAP